MAKRLKRPRDPIALAKLIGDIATGQVCDSTPDDGKDKAAVEIGKIIPISRFAGGANE